MTGAVIGPGREVTLHYRMRLEDGTVVDETEAEPLTFTVGDGTLIPGLESFLTGLAAGAEERFLIAPEEAFGLRDPDNVHTLARSEFPAEMPLEPGTVIGFSTPSGEELPGMVVEADADRVMVDFNHPLAGHQLTFEVRVVAVA